MGRNALERCRAPKQSPSVCAPEVRSRLPSTKGLLLEVVGTEVISWPRSAERGGESLPSEKPGQGQHE